jgi:protein kinase A
MLAGIDPFNDDDPMAIYQKILKGKVKFARSFDMYIFNRILIF